MRCTLCSAHTHVKQFPSEGSILKINDIFLWKCDESQMVFFRFCWHKLCWHNGNWFLGRTGLKRTNIHHHNDITAALTGQLEFKHCPLIGGGQVTWPDAVLWLVNTRWQWADPIIWVHWGYNHALAGHHTGGVNTESGNFNASIIFHFVFENRKPCIHNLMLKCWRSPATMSQQFLLLVN